MAERRRIKHKATFEERLAEEAIKFKEAAEKQPPGSTGQRIAFAARPSGRNGIPHQRLASIPGLQPPKAVENLVSDQKK